MNITSLEEYIPLTPQAFHVLLALARSQNDGYGVMRAVKEDTQGTIKLVSGTAYPLLKRMVKFGFVMELEPSAGSGPEGINRVYRLTDTGRTVLGWELDRYGRAVELGKQRAASIPDNRVQ